MGVACEQNFQEARGVIAHGKLKLVMLGLDDSGKTSLLYSLKQGRKGAGSPRAERQDDESEPSSSSFKLCAPPPTTSPQTKTVKLEGLTFLISDVPGRKSFRDVWFEKIRKAEAVLFVVDSTDLLRLPIVEEELLRIRKAFVTMPILVLATKQDIGESLSSEEISTRLNLQGCDSPLGKECTFVDQCSATDPKSVENALLKFARRP